MYSLIPKSQAKLKEFSFFFIIQRRSPFGAAMKVIERPPSPLSRGEVGLCTTAY